MLIEIIPTLAALWRSAVLSGVNASRGGWNGFDWSRVPTWQSD